MLRDFFQKIKGNPPKQQKTKGCPALKEPTFNVTIRLTVEEHKKLKRAAIEQNTSVSAIIRSWLKSA